MKCKRYGLQPPGAVFERTIGPQDGCRGELEPFGKEPLGDGSGIVEMAHGNQWDPNAVPTHVLEVLDPEIAGDPKLVAGETGTGGIRRGDLDSYRGQLLSPGRLDVARAGPRAAEELLHRVIVPG